MTHADLPRQKGGWVRGEVLWAVQKAHIAKAATALDEGAAHEFGPATKFEAVVDGTRYPPKALLGVACKFAVGQQLGPSDFSGGEGSTCFNVLRRRGVIIREKDSSSQPMAPEDLEVQSEYTWDDLAEVFGFSRNYFQTAGGMITSRKRDALLIITHAGGGKSFNYEDAWDGTDLIYTGKGQHGDQKLVGQNKQLAENARTTYVLQGAGPARLRFLGIATCVEFLWAQGPDKSGNERRILRFRLRFDDAPDAAPGMASGPEGKRRLAKHWRIERNGALVKSAKAHWKQSDPLLRCEVCDVSMRERYGPLGEGYIEAHHRVPLGSLDGVETETDISNLAALCPSCHRMIHRKSDLSVDELRTLVSNAREDSA